MWYSLGVKEHPKVLLVDDEPDLLELLKFSLEEEGFSTLLAGDGNQALELLQANDVDIMVTDIRMPRTSGLRLLKEAKSCRPDIHVVLMSGFSDLTGEQALQMGAAALLPKPFDHKSLIQTIRRALG